ncbi:MAPEG family protein [Frigidibacter oleivorans]|uniref:MAPEG family protein n=1 Tax=Frigidibacter oleivorans TaxID=2487129 RepID=UPI000F8E00C4|nr:MAPEG family protein [Frigidibacter oleivorans]
MTAELTVLALAILLHGGLFVAFALIANRELGPRWTTSPRDEPPKRPLSVTGGRLQRTLDNSFESLILFAPAALMIPVSGQSTAVTAALAWAFLLARILYIPAYVLGWCPARSAIWGVGFLATVAMVVAALI